MSPENATSKDFSVATLAAQTEEIPVCLIEISHPDLSEPIRLSSDKTAFYGFDEDTGEPIYITEHNGHTYINALFSFVPPGLPADGSISKAKFIVAMQPRIRQAIRDVHDNVTFKAILVYASDPDTIIAETPPLWLSNVEYGGQIEAELTTKHFLDRKCPGIKFVPSITPGLFKNNTSS